MTSITRAHVTEGPRTASQFSSVLPVLASSVLRKKKKKKAHLCSTATRRTGHARMRSYTFPTDNPSGAQARRRPTARRGQSESVNTYYGIRVMPMSKPVRKTGRKEGRKQARTPPPSPCLFHFGKPSSNSILPMNAPFLREASLELSLDLAGPRPVTCDTRYTWPVRSTSPRSSTCGALDLELAAP